MQATLGERTIAHFRDTHVARWSLAYCATVWVGLQVLDVLSGTFAWPGALQRPATTMFPFGLMAVWILAGYHGRRGRQSVRMPEVTALFAVACLAAVAIRSVGVAPKAEVGEVELATVRGDMSGALGLASAASPGEGEWPGPSLAVLPFENLSAQPDQRFFVAGFHDNLVTSLSGISSLRVVSRRSVLRYEGSRARLAEIAAELSVGALLEGTVQRDDARIRVLVRLVDPHTGSQVWTQSYDRELDDVFAVQTDIAQRVAHALRARLTRREAKRLGERLTANVTALDFFLRGVEAYEHISKQDNEEAMRLFRLAVEVDPNFAAAWARMADVHMQRVQFFGYPEAQYDSARTVVQRALDLDPDLAHAHKVMGDLAWTEGDLYASLRHLDRATELDPNFYAAINNAGITNLFLGEVAEAKALIGRAHALAPNVVLARSNVGAMHVVLRDLDVAEQWLDQSLALDPKLQPARNWRVLLEVYRGDLAEASRLASEYASDLPDEAVSWTRLALAAMYDRRFEDVLHHIETAQTISPEIRGFEMAPLPLMQVTALARLGRLAEARDRARPLISEVLQRLEAGSCGWIYPWRLAAVHAAIGDEAEAIRWLAVAAESGFVSPDMMHRHPAFDDVRGTAGFRHARQSVQARLEAERREAGL